MNGDEGRLVRLVYNAYKLCVFSHCKADGDKVLSLSRVAARDCGYSGGAVKPLDNEAVNLLVFIRDNARDEGALSAEEQPIYNERSDEGGDYAEERHYHIFRDEYTESDYRGVDKEDDSRAAKARKRLTDYKGENINSAR